MNWNNGLERKKFEAKWKKVEEAYLAAGMESAAIEEMRRYDWDDFKKRRIAALHEQALVSSSFDDDDSDDTQSALLEKFLNSMSTSDEVSVHHSRYWWIEEINDQELVKALLALPAATIEVVTLFAFEGWKQGEIAKYMGCAQSNIARRIHAAKKIIKKYL